jgi:hypothetical protein
MPESWHEMVAKVSEFFAPEQIEASARRTKFVQRTSKITGKLFVALVTVGRWSSPTTSVAQLNRTTQHSYTQAASCESAASELSADCRASTAAVTSGV